MRRNVAFIRGLKLVNVDRLERNSLVVNVGANDASELFGKDATLFAKREAKKRGFYHLIDKEPDYRAYGQNNLLEREFYFKR